MRGKEERGRGRENEERGSVRGKEERGDGWKMRREEG